MVKHLFYIWVYSRAATCDPRATSPGKRRSITVRCGEVDRDFRPEFWVARGGIEPPTFRFSGGRSYQLSYLAVFLARVRADRTSARASPGSRKYRAKPGRVG